MKQEWTPDELTEHFTLQEGEHAFVRAHAPHTTLGKALLLKWFQYAAQFPPDPADIPPAVVAYMAQQLDVPAQVFAAYKWHGRRIKDHRKAIRAWCGFRTVTLHDQAALRDWLTNDVLPDEYRPARDDQRTLPPATVARGSRGRTAEGWGLGRGCRGI